MHFVIVLIKTLCYDLSAMEGLAVLIVDWFLKVFGWCLATALGVWRITDAIRYRHDIKIDVCISERDGTEFLEVTVRNNGRRPFHVIDAGLLYSNGEAYPFLSPYFEQLPASVITAEQKISLKMPSFWVYKRRPYHYSLDLAFLKKEIKEQDTTVDKVYVTQETGDDEELIIPENIKETLNG